MNNEKLTYYAYESISARGVKDSESMEISLNIPDYSRFLILFIISHMGGDSISSSNTNAHWRFSLTTSGGTNVKVNDRNETCLLIPHIWDASASTLAMATFGGETYKFKAENKTGATTNATYTSTFSIRLIRMAPPS